MKDLRKLPVWEKSHRLTLDVYKTTASCPTTEVKRMLATLVKALRGERIWLTTECQPLKADC